MSNPEHGCQGALVGGVPDAQIARGIIASSQDGAVSVKHSHALITPTPQRLDLPHDDPRRIDDSLGAIHLGEGVAVIRVALRQIAVLILASCYYA